MTEPLEQAALDAVRSAAERLGVDPFRLARFLANGKIADFLGALSRYEAMTLEKEQMAQLTQEYLEFLEEEMGRSRGHEGDPGGAADGG